MQGTQACVNKNTQMNAIENKLYDAGYVNTNKKQLSQA